MQENATADAATMMRTAEITCRGRRRNLALACVRKGSHLKYEERRKLRNGPMSTGFLDLVVKARLAQLRKGVTENISASDRTSIPVAAVELGPLSIRLVLELIISQASI